MYGQRRQRILTGNILEKVGLHKGWQKVINYLGRAWGLEEDVAVHVQWSEPAGRNKLTADEVNDIRGMLHVRGLLPLSIYVCICVCTRSYTNINTGTQTRKAMITLPLCVAIDMH